MIYCIEYISSPTNEMEVIFSKTKQHIINNKIAVFLSLAIIITKLFFILTFNNVDWEPDSYMHYLDLRTVFTDFPNNLIIGLGVWSKPLYTYILGIPAHFQAINNFVLIETINILISSVISYITYIVVRQNTSSRKLGILAIVLTSFSLTLLKSSTSVLTDPIFTLCLVAGYYLLTREKIKLSSFFIGISVLGRIEGLFFIGIYFFVLFFKFKISKELIINTIILGLPVFIWNFLGYINTGYPLYIFDSGYPTTAGIYGYGQIYSMVWQLLSRELIIFTLYILSIFIIIKKKLLSKRTTLLLIWTIGFILIESFLWWRGIMGSAGLLRYFVCIIPFMVILGVEPLKEFKLNKQIILSIGILQILFTLIFVAGLIPNKQEYPKVDEDLITVGEWINENIPAETFIGSDRPEVIFYAERNLENSTIFYRHHLNNKRSGIYVWTKDWGEQVSKVRLEELESAGQLQKEINENVFIYLIK